VIATFICIDNIQYDVEITICHKDYDPASATAPCADNNHAANSFTTVKKVCATGIPLPPDNQKVLKAVFCALDPLSGNKLGLKSRIPFCDDNPGVYCWVIAMPRCVTRIGQCLVRCPYSQCCIRQWRFCKDRPSGNITILPGGLDCSTENANCNSGCLEEVCQYYVPGTCPPCP